MKNLRFLKCLMLAMIIMAVSPLMAQTPIPAESHGIFAKAADWFKGGIASMAFAFVFGLFAKKGWTLIIKKIANQGKAVCKEIGQTFLASSNFMDVLDNSIKADGSLAENSTKELLAAGKEVIAEAHDVIISIKPNPKNASITFKK